MSNFIKKIRTQSGDVQIDYEALANRPTSDKTLTQEGSFADAKEVGDRLSSLSDDIANKEPSGTAEVKITAHNASIDSHNDIRLLIQNLVNTVNELLDSDDETLDQTSEIVAYVKSNKSLIDAITTNKVSVADIIDNLTTNASNKPLSAAQGVALKNLIDAIVIPKKLSELQNDSGYALKTELPTVPGSLPNPFKLTFEGAVSAEYDGSGAVVVTIPDGKVERIEKASTDTVVELEAGKLYIFPEMATLTYTIVGEGEVHFIFKSGATATEVVHPSGVNVGSFSVEANKVYEVSILEGLLTSQSWAVTV